MAVTATQVQNLYLAYFGRPAEQAGLTYWTAQTSATVDQVSAAFAQQTEYTATYGSLTRLQTVDKLYQNLFGRTAQSNELAYWNNSADISISKLALALTNGATGTDRLTLDNKIQFASVVTTSSGTAGTVDTVKAGFNPTVFATSPAGVANTQYAGVAAYVAAFTSATVTAAQAAANYYALANTSLQATLSPTITGNGNAQAVPTDFKSQTAGTVNLSGASGTHTITLPDANKATAVSLAGTISAAEGLTFSESTTAGVTKIIDTLNVNVSSTSTSTDAATKVLTLNIPALTALKTIDASASSASINLGTNLDTNTSLTSVKTGAGADSLSINTANFSAAATVTIDTGAGNDTVTATVGAAALNISTGDGIDTLTLTTGNANLTVNAGLGNDLVTLLAKASNGGTSHVAVIDLGGGNDTLKIGNATTDFANLHGTGAGGAGATTATLLAQDLIKVSNFNAGDKLDLSIFSVTKADSDSFVALTAQGNTDVAASANLLAAATAAANSVTSAANNITQAAPNGVVTAHVTTFQYGGNTYVLHADTTTGLNTGDGLIELTGFQGTFAATPGATGVLTAA